MTWPVPVLHRREEPGCCSQQGPTRDVGRVSWGRARRPLTWAAVPGTENKTLGLTQKPTGADTLGHGCLWVSGSPRKTRVLQAIHDVGRGVAHTVLWLPFPGIADPREGGSWAAQIRNLTFQGGSRETQRGQPASLRPPSRSGAKERLSGGILELRMLELGPNLMGEEWEQSQEGKAT